MKHKKSVIRQWGIPVAGAVLLIVLVLWQMGVFQFGKVRPGEQPMAADAITGTFVTVEEIEVPETYRTAGTVNSRTHTFISARIVARVVEVLVRAGDFVTNGTLLARLDDADLSAGVRQAAEQVKAAQAGVSAAAENVSRAQAAYDLATADVQRMRPLLASGAISQQALDTAESQFRQARAALAQAEQGRMAALAEMQAAQQAQRQAEAVMSYATLYSPSDAVVAERYAEPGDLASPGKTLFDLFDAKRLMLEVPVREGLVQRLKLGERVPFTVGALNKTITGEIREIVPAVDPGSRTFLVRICIGEAPGLVPGMFGMLELPLGTRRALIVPEEAVTRAGQLEYVHQKTGGRVQRTLVRTAPGRAGTLEVISGLAAGAQVQVGE